MRQPYQQPDTVALVAGVARALAREAELPRALQQVAALVAAARPFEECSIWLFDPAGSLERVAASAGSTLTREEVLAARHASVGREAAAGARGGELHGPCTLPPAPAPVLAPAPTPTPPAALSSVATLVAPLPPQREDGDGRVSEGGDDALGVLAIRTGAGGSDDGPRDPGLLASTIAPTIADMLAPAVAHSRRRESLELELARRVRQVNDERRFTERIIDSLPVGLYVIDRDYRIEVWNRKRETGLQGVSREEAVGRTIFEILHRQPAEMLRQEFDDAFHTGRVQHFSMESSSTGELRYYRITKIPMRDDGGEITHVITLGEDVTDWREAQERFAQAEKLAAIGQLAAGVMHEINNPLATIAACAESLSLALGDAARHDAAVPAESGEYLRIVESEVQRCKRIVDRLLEFSRPGPLAPEPVELNAVVEQTLFLLKHHSRFKRFTVQVELDPTAPVTRGNPEQLVQVLMALLINAMDSMGDEGVIGVRTLRGPGSPPLAVMEVRDHGHGIPRPQLAKIFEPFYTTKAAGRGTGLGLSICYGIVAEHGGRIEVESDVEQGSVFRVELPPGGTEVGGGHA